VAQGMMMLLGDYLDDNIDEVKKKVSVTHRRVFSVFNLAKKALEYYHEESFTI
jgi:hypothetical protein